MLFIARHGETEWNLADRIQGKGDSPLTARGVAQARGLAAFLVEVAIDRLYASPQGRARRTAEIVAEATGCTPQFDDRLVEADYGVADGLTIAEARARYPGEWERREADRWGVALPGGESIAEVWRRAESFAGDCLSGVVDDEAVRVGRSGPSGGQPQPTRHCHGLAARGGPAYDAAQLRGVSLRWRSRRVYQNA